MSERYLQDVVKMLQGEWRDDIGLKVKITGRTAVFGNGTGPWDIGQERDGAVVLRGSRLEGDLAAGRPVWRSPRGVNRHWSRLSKATPDDAAWRLLFHRYKADRFLVRKELLAAVMAADWQRTTLLKRRWKEEPAFPADATDEQRTRLSSGRDLVPGMCFVHQRDGYRGVIFACEPWCTAPEAWKLNMKVAELARGEAQPFYHCVVEKGGPGGSISFEAEENIQLVFAGEENLAFPVTSPLVDGLFERCDQFSGYVPKAPLVWRGKMP